MSDINVFVTSALTSSERRISKQWTLAYFKQRLELITGIPPQWQRVLVYPSSTMAQAIELTSNTNNNESIANSDLNGSNNSNNNDENVRLSSFDALRPLVRVHVDDIRPDSDLKDLARISASSSSNNNNDPASGGINGDGKDLEDEDDELSKARFKYDEKSYQSRQDSVLYWKKQHKLGRFSPEVASLQQLQFELNLEKSKSIKVGDRCQILSENSPACAKNTDGRRGTVKYVGPVPEIPYPIADFIWIGIALDEPLGKNDGSVKGSGKRYFECGKNYGSFVKPVNVEVGEQFGVVDLMDEMEMGDSSEDEL